MRYASTIIMTFVVCMLALATLAHTVQAEPLPAAPTTIYLPLITGASGIQTAEQQAVAAQVLALINAERARGGCSALTTDQKLTAAAQSHSRDMASNNFFDHRGSTGSMVGDRVTAVSYSWRSVGENIAAGYGDAAEVVAGWMASPGHRASILNCAYVHTGIGYLHDPNDGKLADGDGPYYRYWTQVFGAPR